MSKKKKRERKNNGRKILRSNNYLIKISRREIDEKRDNKLKKKK